jgi:pimeloyl-ACP methyl ester carboxylesterase
MGLDFKGFTHEELKGIKAQILISLGDRDGVRVEHAVEMFRLIPNSQLAVFPNADHLALWLSPEKVLPTIAAFLEAPMPEPKEQSR